MWINYSYRISSALRISSLDSVFRYIWITNELEESLRKDCIMWFKPQNFSKRNSKVTPNVYETYINEKRIKEKKMTIGWLLKKNKVTFYDTQLSRRNSFILNYLLRTIKWPSVFLFLFLFFYDLLRFNKVFSLILVYGHYCCANWGLCAFANFIGAKRKGRKKYAYYFLNNYWYKLLINNPNIKK